MSVEWGPWIEHDGTGCPVHPSVIVHTIDAAGGEEIGPAGDESDEYGDSWTWEKVDTEFGIEIIRYRVRKPRALIKLQEMIADLPTPTERVDA